MTAQRRFCYICNWFSWEVDKMDMECGETVWTFYINPKKSDTIKPTVSESVIGKAPEQEYANDTESAEPVETKKMHPSESCQSKKETKS